MQPLVASSVEQRNALLLDSSVISEADLMGIVVDIMELGEAHGIFADDKKLEMLTTFVKSNRKYS